MSTNHIHGPEVATATGSGQAAATSSAMSVPFERIVQQMDDAAVAPLSGGTAQLGYPDWSYRHNFGAMNGNRIITLIAPAGRILTPRSRVFVAISEGLAGGPDVGKFIGAARYTVHNIAPRAGAVDVWVNIEWGAPILLYADFLVINFG